MAEQAQPCPHWADYVNQSLIGQLIYKDECTKCFLTPKDEHGLNVCMKCFLGSCASQAAGHNHQEAHYARSEHPIYLNLKMVPKAVPAEGENVAAQQITKLAIGKPGGIDADTDKYDTLATVHCKLCDSDLPLANPAVASMVDSILLTQSAYNQGTISEWELELNSCTHTQNLDQSLITGHINVKAAAHCASCDLKSNLWLCMHCGNLGCGRRYYDGSGGNNHGVDHWEATGHAVALKLGTITADGTASIHCYACSDDVLDDKLAEHLRAVGIDMGTQVKTEKSMAEMNLEANLNLSLSKVLEEGKTLVPVFGPGLTGMENLGNSCYMNSVVQVLFNLPEFRGHYLPTAETHLQNCVNRAPDCTQCQISKLVIGLQSGEYSQKKIAQKIIVAGEEVKTDEEQKEVDFYQDGIRPAIFKTLIGKGHEEFKTGQQQDARQYFSYLLEKFLLNEKKQKSGADPHDAFNFELESRLQCMTCNRVKYNRIQEQCLLLTIPVASSAEKGTPVSLDACLEATFADSVIEGFSCPQCNAKTNVTDRKRFISYPRNLAVCLKRIVFDDWVPKKLEVELQTAQEGSMDLSRFGGGTCELKDGEEGFPMAEEPDMIEPEVDMNMVNQLVQNGVPEMAAKHAVHHAGANGVDEAIMWFYGNIENPVVSTPLLVPNPKKGAANNASASAGGFVADPESLMMLTSMGFSDKQATRALRKCDGNLERAGDWVMSHMDDPDTDEEVGGGMEVDQSSAVETTNYFAEREETKGDSVFKLQSFITHLGSSIHAGHYVCHARQQDDPTNWIYYNDAKVALDQSPPIGKGYMYFFRKQQA